MNDLRDIIKSAVFAEQADNIPAILSDAQTVIAEKLAELKELSAVGKDNADLQSAIKYLEGAAILLGRIVQRNIQQKS